LSLFTGVASSVGIVDLALWHEFCNARAINYSVQMEAIFGGPPSAGTSSEYRARSPLAFADTFATIPISLQHGIRDNAVLREHSLLLWGALGGDASRLDGVTEADLVAISRSARVAPAYLASQAEAAGPYLFGTVL